MRRANRSDGRAGRRFAHKNRRALRLAAALALAIGLAGAPGQVLGQEPSVQKSGTDSKPASKPNDPGGTAAIARIIDIEIPQDFVAATKSAAGAAATLNGERHLGGLKFAGSVEAQMRKEGPVTLFITSMVSAEKVAYPDASIHSEFELLRTSPERGVLNDADVKAVSWATELVGGGARADLHWRHLAYETETHARALAFRVESGQLHYSQAECIHPLEPTETGTGPLSVLCKSILATMAIPDTKSGSRPAVSAAAIAGQGANAAGDAAAPVGPPITEPAVGTGGTLPADGNLPQMTLRDPGELGDAPLPVIPVSKPKERNYRQLLYIIGGILLVLAFYFTTRSRTAIESDEEARSGDGDDDDSDGANGNSDGDGDSGDDGGGDDDDNSDESEDKT